MSAKHTECRGCLLVAVPVLLLLASCTGAVRVREQEGRIWERKAYEFCVNEEHDVQCGGVPDDSGNVDQVIAEVKVSYNRKQQLGSRSKGNLRRCKQTDSSTSSAKSCDVSYLENLKKCKDRTKCHIIPSDHPHCEDEEFWALRLVIFCGAGEPAETLDDQSMQITKGGESEAPLAGTTLSDGNDGSGATTPFVVEVAAQLGVVRHKVQKEVEDPYITGIELVPCYRWYRSQKILDHHEFFGSWKHGEFLARLTNCGHDEGCFMVKFQDGTVYNDAQVEPDPYELAKGELFKADDHFWVTWRGIGLKRNDYNTWGVCLPKTRSMDFAVLQWDELRKKASNTVVLDDAQKKAVFDATGETVSTADEAKEAWERWAEKKAGNTEVLDDDQKKAVFDATGETVSTAGEAKEAWARWAETLKSS